MVWMVFLLFLRLPSNCEDSRLLLSHQDRTKARGDMRLGLHVNRHPGQRLPFSSWQEYRVFLRQLIKKKKSAFFATPLE